MTASTKEQKTKSLGSGKKSASVTGARPGYKHTKLGWIPEEWGVSMLGDLGTISMCKRIFKDETTANGDVPFFKIGSFGGAPDAFISLDRYEEYRRRFSFPKVGDILISAAGTIGRTVAYDGQPAYFQDSNIVWIDNNEEHVLNAYLFYLYPMIKWETDTSTIPRLYNESIRQTRILAPSLPEQRRIAAVLGAWDRAIATTQQLVVAQQQRKQGLMQELLTGKRRFPRFGLKAGTRYVKTRIGMMPSDWNQLPMRRLFTERDECGFNDLPLLSVTATGVVLQSDTERRDNSKEDKSAYKRICPGDIGYNTMRMWQGRSAVSRIEGIVSPAYTIVTPTKLMDVEYAGHLFQYQPMVHLFYRYSQGMASDTWNLKYKHFGPIIIPVPSMEEQRAIATLLTSIDSYVTVLQTTLDHLIIQKRGLMQQLLTGVVRVKQ